MGEQSWLLQDDLHTWYRSLDELVNKYHWGMNVDDAQSVGIDGFEYGFDARLNNYGGMTIVDIGGAALLNHIPHERPADKSDYDLAIAHDGHPNDSHHEGQCLDYSLALHGFIPREGYDPSAERINVFRNAHAAWKAAEESGDEDAEKRHFNDLKEYLSGIHAPTADHSLFDIYTDERRKETREHLEDIEKVDVFAGEKPLETYPIGWIERYAEPVIVDGAPLRHVKTLSLPALAARKVFRATIDHSGGAEDEDQEYDLGTIYDYVSNDMDVSEQGAFRDTFNEAWVFLCAANQDKVADYKLDLDVAGHFKDRHIWEQVEDAVADQRIKEFDIPISQFMSGQSYGWHYFADEENRKDPKDF